MTLSGQHVDTARLSRRGPLGRLLHLLVWLLPLWCLLLLGAAPAAAAVAAPALSAAAEAAPMCDPMGASVVALPEIPEVDGGRLEEMPCEALLLMTGWRLDAPELNRKAALHDPEPQQPHSFQHYKSRYDGACDVRVAFPSRVEPLLSRAPRRQGLRARRGHELGVYRPPLARA